jgi:hypothetical protein
MVIRLRVRPAKYIKSRVTTMETGILMPMIRVGLKERRKRKRTRTAKIAPERAVEIT